MSILPSSNEIKKYEAELVHLRQLQLKYGLDIPYVKMIFWGWRKTLIFVIKQFEPNQYQQLFEEESESFVFALETLNKLPLKKYNKVEVEKVLIECQIPTAFYEELLSKVFK